MLRCVYVCVYRKNTSRKGVYVYEYSVSFFLYYLSHRVMIQKCFMVHFEMNEHKTGAILSRLIIYEHNTDVICHRTVFWPQPMTFVV